MSERLTVVFDDTELYRRLKVSAAEQSVPVKHLIQEAVRRYLGPALPKDEGTPIDWAAFDDWMREAAEIDRELPETGVNDYSDVKKHLYGRERRPGEWFAPEPRLATLAEEPAVYDAE